MVNKLHRYLRDTAAERDAAIAERDQLREEHAKALMRGDAWKERAEAAEEEQGSAEQEAQRLRRELESLRDEMRALDPYRFVLASELVERLSVVLGDES